MSDRTLSGLDSLSMLSEQELEALAVPAAEAVEMPSTRYLDLGPIGRGGMGEVRRVLDRHLGCTLAMKTLSPHLLASQSAMLRFQAEIRVTARLIHPGVVSVQDHGVLADGRPWFTMTEVHGEDLATVLAGRGWSLRRCIEALSRVCEVMAYAHSVGVIHRDLKPANVMIGSFGEVYVMDWGLARVSGTLIDPAHQTALFDDGDALKTRLGQRLGTPAYMAPEQAAGSLSVGPTNDVFSLGAMLHHILTGAPPGKRALRGPQGLVDLCRQAMVESAAARLEDAGAVLHALQGWLDGVRRAEQAAELVQQADALHPRIEERRQEAAALRQQGEALLSGVAVHDPEEKKRAGWALQDRADAAAQQAELDAVQWLQLLRGALNRDPEHAPAHARLADHYATRLMEAERIQDAGAAVRMEALLRAHDRGQHARLLSGEGRLTLVTKPAGALVTAARYIREGRRLVTGPAQTLGTTPLVEAPLERGSYLLTVTAPGHHPMRYPVALERGEHWHGCPPGADEPHPVPLMPLGSLGEDDCYVPAGWCRIGGDPKAADVLSVRRVWIDGLVVCRFQVTCCDYLQFLNDLAPSEARKFQPVAEGWGEGGGAIFLYENDRFQLPTSSYEREQTWELSWPATMLDWSSMVSFSKWRSSKTGLPWRLPHGLEWEKAARGVDGRFFPWGNFAESTWANSANARESQPGRLPVDSYPLDVSPFGVRGMAGNVRDWCINAYSRDGVPDGSRLVVDPPAEAAYRMMRGGSWASKIDLCRLASRFADPPSTRFSVTGFRLVRPI